MILMALALEACRATKQSSDHQTLRFAAYSFKSVGGPKYPRSKEVHSCSLFLRLLIRLDVLVSNSSFHIIHKFHRVKSLASSSSIFASQSWMSFLALSWHCFQYRVSSLWLYTGTMHWGHKKNDIAWLRLRPGMFFAWLRPPMFAWLRPLMFAIEATSICLVEATNVRCWGH